MQLVFNGIWFEAPFSLPNGVHPSEVIVRASPYRPIAIANPENGTSFMVHSVEKGLFFCHFHSEALREASYPRADGFMEVRKEMSIRDVYSVVITQPEENGISLNHFSHREQQLFKIAAAFRESEKGELLGDWRVFAVTSFDEIGHPVNLETNRPMHHSLVAVSPDIRLQRIPLTIQQDTAEYLVYVLESAFPDFEG